MWAVGDDVNLLQALDHSVQATAQQDPWLLGYAKMEDKKLKMVESGDSKAGVSALFKTRTKQDYAPRRNLELFGVNQHARRSTKFE